MVNAVTRRCSGPPTAATSLRRQASNPSSTQGFLGHAATVFLQIRPYLLGVTTALPALFYGLTFGLALGLVAKGPLIVTWVVFVVSFIVTLSTRILIAELGLGRVGESLTDPLIWLTLLCTLLFLFVGHWVRSAYACRAAA
jgi:hypothetical protein